MFAGKPLIRLNTGNMGQARAGMPPPYSIASVAQSYGEQNANMLRCLVMDEGRKRVVLIAASILAARKLAQFDGGKKVPATMSAVADAVRWAEEIMKAIDDRWPAGR